MLSIIVPTLNEEKYLPLLLQSIKEQSFRDLEIVVADAGSTDRTVEIAKEYGCRIVKGGLPARGRNQGALEAKGDIFLFLDADLVLQKDSLGRLLDEFKKRDLSIATCCLGSVSGSRREKFFYDFFYNFYIMIVERIFPHGAILIIVRRNVHEAVNGFDETIKLAEDHFYTRQVAKLGKFGILKSANILASPRRFERDGWFTTYIKYLLCEIHLVFLGPVRTDIFKYEFDHYEKKDNDKNLKI